jgi:hypothetical protein
MLKYSNCLVNSPFTSSNCNNTLTHSHPLQSSQSPPYQHPHILEPPVEPTQHPVDPTCEPIYHTLPLGNITSRPYPVSPPMKQCKQLSQPYSPGELGKSATCNARLLQWMRWHSFFRYLQTPNSINPTINTINHLTARYIHALACNGVPAFFQQPWGKHKCDSAYKRGSHFSASKHFSTFLHQDMYDYVHMGYCVVLSYSAVQHYPALRLAPIGAVPQ